MRTIKLEFLFLVVVLSTLHSPGVYAEQSCDTILIGIHQQEFVSSNVDKLKTTLDILKRYEVSSFEQAKDTAATAGFSLPLEGVPVSFQLGYKADSKGKGNWANQLETYFSSHAVETSKYVQQIETANKDVVEAWSECVSKKTGVVAWPEQEKDEGEFVILIAYRPTAKEDAKIKGIEFGTQFEPLSDKNNYIDKKLRFDGRATIIRVKRRANTNAQGQIIIRTTANDTYINLRPFPKVNTTPLPPRPKIDFDNDRLSDSYGFVGPNPYSIEVMLGNGQKVKTSLPSEYNPYLPQVQFVTGDFNGDDLTDLAAIVTSGADYAHIHLSKGDGSFHGNHQFYFKPHASGKNVYDSMGTWNSRYCNNLGKSVLHHIPVPGTHDVEVTDGYYWIPGDGGTAFSINASNPCP